MVEGVGVGVWVRVVTGRGERVCRQRQEVFLMVVCDGDGAVGQGCCIVVWLVEVCGV